MRLIEKPTWLDFIMIYWFTLTGLLQWLEKYHQYLHVLSIFIFTDINLTKNQCLKLLTNTKFEVIDLQK